MKNQFNGNFLLTFLYFIVFIIGFENIWAQNITIKQALSVKPGICDQNEFVVTVRNDETMDWDENVLTVQLPCGFQYVVSTVSGALEKNITNLNSPVFEIGTIPQKTEREIRFLVALTCETLGCLNNGEIFNNKYNLVSAQGQINHVSENYNVETPNIVISEIQSPFMEVGIGNVISRKLTIKNTRQGRVSNFILEDLHDDLLTITMDVGKIITQSPGKIVLEMDSTVFKNIGNEDNFFDFGEELILTENILADGCILVTKFVQSEIKVSWGCYQETCKSNLVRATIRVLPREDPGDKISLSGNVEEPDCTYNSSATQTLSVFVKPTASALKNIEIVIEPGLNTKGIIVGSVVLPEGFTVSYVEETISSCGQSVAKNIKISNTFIPSSNAGRTFDIDFDVAFCSLTVCDVNEQYWKASYEYQKVCTRIDDVVHKGSYAAFSKNNSKVELEILIQGVIGDGKAGVIKYTYQNAQLSDSPGNLRVKFRIPVILQLINTNFAVGNIIPVVNQNMYGGYNNIELLYPLPINPSSFTLFIPFVVNCAALTDSLPCKKYISTCLDTCNSPNYYTIATESTIIFDPNCPAGGHFENCLSLTFESSCEKECTQEEIVGGYIDFTFDVVKKTLGLPDKNNDGMPDADGIYDMEQIRHDQIFYGDTFDIMMVGRVATSHPDSVFKNGFARINLVQATNFINPQNREYLNNAMQVESVSLALWDKSENTRWVIDDIPYIFDEGTYFFNLSRDTLKKLNFQLPVNFVFEDGDSLVLNVRKIYSKNFATPSVGWNNHTLEFQYFLPRFSVTNNEVKPDESYFSCGCIIKPMTLVGFNYWSQWAIPGVAQCPGVTNSQGVLLNYGFPQASPGEIKYFIRPITYKIQKANNIRLDSLSLSNGIFPEKTYVQYTEDDKFYYVDISDFTTYQNFRRGLRIWLYRSAETCIGEVIPATTSEIIYEKSNVAQDIFTDKITYTVQNFLTVPKINLEIQQREFTALFPEIQIPLKLINETNNQVRNVFIRPVYDTQNFNGAQIELSGLPVNYPDINGYFVMGNMFQKEIRDILFSISSLNCGRQKVVFEYGYDCGVYSNPAEKPCFLKRDSFFIDFQDGELEILIDQNEIMIELCDTVFESKFTIYNSGLGHVFQLKPLITLPPGMNLVSGSCKLEFPSGSGQIINIPDPDTISAGNYQWNLASFWQHHEENGLSSVQNVPQNSFDIKYKTTTDCNFISGSNEEIIASGEQACGSLTNKLAKSGPYLSIPGQQDSVEIILSALFPDTLVCQETWPVSIMYENGHTDISYLYVTLPPNVEPVTGSFNGNLPVNSPVFNAGVWEWSIPPGIPTVHLQFNVKALADAPCQSSVIEIKTSSGREAFCQATQTFCQIQDISGRLLLPVEIVKPGIKILRLEMINHPDSSDYFVESDLLIEGVQQVIKAKLIYDENGDNKLGVDDPVLKEIFFDPQNAVQNIIHINTSLQPGLFFNTCKLWLVINQNENCLCQSDTIQIINKTIFTTDTLLVCWNDSIKLGPGDINGKLYQWNEGVGLSCNQCGLSDFYIPNNDYFQPVSYFRQLTEVDIFSGCVKEYNFLIEVYPKPKILSSVDTFCMGDTLKLFTTEFSDTYNWYGANIIEDEGSFVKAVVMNSGWINVDFVDSIGCITKDSLYIPVREIPQIQFINDGNFCYGQDAMVGYNPQPGLEYTWIDPDMLLADLMSNISALADTSSGLVYVLVENGGCFQLDSLSIVQYQGVSVSGLQDSFIVCQGDTLVIELQGADHYEWLDPNFGTCLNDFCSRLAVVPTSIGYLSTQVAGITSEGCRDTFPVRILSISETLQNINKQNICQGDTVRFMGQSITQSGLYCDTIATGACYYIQCLDVTVLPVAMTMLKENICPGDTLYLNGNIFTEAGQYEWKVQTAQGCDSLIVLQLDILEGPEINLTQNVEIIEGEFTTVTLPNQFTYVWSPGSGLNCSTCAIVTIEGREAIVYTITVTDISGCSSVYQLSVSVIEICKPESMVIPNAFTPNGDQQNDVFTIPSLKVCEINITIFNRWGNIVYQQSPFDNQWDGRSSNGSDLPSGTYYYLIETLDSAVKRTGMIDLRRQ